VQLGACYAVALFHRTSGAVLIVPVAASLGVAPHELGAVAIVFFWVYAALQLPSGVLADVMGSRRLAIAGCVATGAGALAFGLAGEVWLAVAARALIAAGSAVMFVSMVRHTTANWPAEQVATVIGRSIFVGNLGTIASSAPLALALVFVDWRTLSLVLGATSFAFAIGLWSSGSRANEVRIGRARVRMLVPQIRDVLGNRSNHYGLVILAGLAGSYWAFVGLWALPLLLAKDVPARTAVWSVSIMMACYAVGAPIFGWIADRLKRHAMTLSMACAGAVICWAVLASRLTLTPGTLAVVLFALGFFSSGFHLVFAMVTERNPVEHAGTATSYINIGTFLGAAVIQTIGVAMSNGQVTPACVMPMAIGSVVALAVSATLWPRRTRALATAARALSATR